MLTVLFAVSDQPEVPQVFQLLLHDGLLEDVIIGGGRVASSGLIAAVRHRILLLLCRPTPRSDGGTCGRHGRRRHETPVSDSWIIPMPL